MLPRLLGPKTHTQHVNQSRAEGNPGSRKGHTEYTFFLHHSAYPEYILAKCDRFETADVKRHGFQRAVGLSLKHLDSNEPADCQTVGVGVSKRATLAKRITHCLIQRTSTDDDDERPKLYLAMMWRVDGKMKCSAMPALAVSKKFPSCIVISSTLSPDCVLTKYPNCL